MIGHLILGSWILKWLLAYKVAVLKNQSLTLDNSSSKLNKPDVGHLFVTMKTPSLKPIYQFNLRVIPVTKYIQDNKLFNQLFT